MLAVEAKPRLSLVAKASRFPRGLWMTSLASGWIAIPSKPSLVWIAAFMAGRTRAAWLLRLQLLGVTIVAIQLLMGAAQVETRSGRMVKRKLLDRAQLRTVAPSTGLLSKEHVFVSRLVAAGIPTVPWFASTKVEF